MQHVICHIEIPVQDPATCSEFYAELFGWEVQTHTEMNYVTFDGGEGTHGGFPQIDPVVGNPGSVLIYVSTDDVDASLASAVNLGATVVRDKTPIPGVGEFAIFSDPSGNPIALFREV